MKFYTVHEPPDPPVDRIDRAEKLMFIHDGFTPTVVAFGPLWLLGNRLWGAAAAYFGIALALLVLVIGLGQAPQWISLLLGAMNLILGFEAAKVTSWTWRLVSSSARHSLRL